VTFEDEVNESIFGEAKVLSPLRYALGFAAFVMKWRKKASPNVAERRISERNTKFI